MRNTVSLQFKSDNNMCATFCLNFDIRNKKLLIFINITVQEL